MRHGLPFEAFFTKIQAAQIEIMPASLKPGVCSIDIATAFFKVVSERGSWGEDPTQEDEEGWEAGTPSRKQLAC